MPFKLLLFLIFSTGSLMVILPYFLLHAQFHHSIDLGWWRLAGLIPILTGLPIFLWCVWDFAVTGQGTPSPLDPPKFLVKKGLYRYSRNPMYTGIMLMLTGEAIYLQSFTLLIYTVIVFAVLYLFTVWYEEPTLTKLFPDSYPDYCRRTPRWFSLQRKK
jgi:protein-S-isoprenylcysteine O-methyltransferase Ste14